MKTFANLDIPSSSETDLEQCPLCPLTIPLSQFATHVYECIKKLDPEEEKYQEEKSMQVALQLAGDEPQDILPSIQVRCSA